MGFVRYEIDDAYERPVGEDDTDALGSLLIAADGANSPIRRQFFPTDQAQRRSTGVFGFAAKVPLNPTTSPVIDSNLATSEHRSYFIVSFGALAASEYADEQPTTWDPARAWAEVTKHVADWHPHLKTLVANADLRTVHGWDIQSSEKPTWGNGANLHPLLASQVQGVKVVKAPLLIPLTMVRAIATGRSSRVVGRTRPGVEDGVQWALGQFRGVRAA
ncbi:uncharacterized protein EV422DRAFT_569131 [Fimicolochytrium jonesii]|uniref:uncharacterized protein n=1 Tax=Fimicolochytrium jonesii TaxID=1396493 RepID=UPI0022FE28EC|nr:uncharacterized protein EV422DRAFT_569131 [Fimicolochytrium jonesii]KAI8819258.1 hypothetical protein EV422DRAFT_569131 [Fimicolochytrium jonesii]